VTHRREDSGRWGWALEGRKDRVGVAVPTCFAAVLPRGDPPPPSIGSLPSGDGGRSHRREEERRVQ
jgi:hypothetical protein